MTVEEKMFHYKCKTHTELSVLHITETALIGSADENDRTNEGVAMYWRRMCYENTNNLCLQ